MIVLAFLAAAAATVSPEQVTAMERWLPTIVSICGVLIIALVTAFKVGAKFTIVTQTVESLSTEVVEMKAAVKEGFAHARGGRKELHAKVDEMKTTQTEQGKDIEHQTKTCDSRHRQKIPTPASGGVL